MVWRKTRRSDVMATLRFLWMRSLCCQCFVFLFSITSLSIYKMEASIDSCHFGGHAPRAHPFHSSNVIILRRHWGVAFGGCFQEGHRSQEVQVPHKWNWWNEQFHLVCPQLLIFRTGLPGNHYGYIFLAMPALSIFQTTWFLFTFSSCYLEAYPLMCVVCSSPPKN